MQQTGVEQVMWPTHCVQQTYGAEFHPLCPLHQGEIVIDKGTITEVDSYSGFGSHPKKTNLLQELESRGIKTVYCVGLAYDYCVGSTAVDAATLGFQTFILKDATKSVS